MTYKVNGNEGPVLLLAHGAGAPMDSTFMSELAEKLSDRKIQVVRFEFEYMAQRRETGVKKPPQSQKKLLAQWAEHIEHWAQAGRPLFIGGKSMGGRMASLVATELTAPAGVLCFGYPFHPPGKPDRWRTEHFTELKCPLWIAQGERDPFGKREEVVSRLTPVEGELEINWIPAGDHDLKPTKASGRSHDENLALAADGAAAFIRQRVRTL